MKIRLMPLIDLGKGKDVNINVLNLMTDKVAAVYATEAYLLARVFIPPQKTFTKKLLGKVLADYRIR
jgi:hemolysin activation/secretion protein